MVKGTARQIILVDSPDPALFDKAIFILKDGCRGASSQELVREAQRIAAEYLRGDQTRRIPRLQPVLCLLAGAAAVGLIWLIAGFV